MTIFGWVLAAIGLAGIVMWSGLWMIRETQAGLVIKRFGPPLPSGRIIALNGEAGYQARLLSPGWHVGLWRWQYKVDQGAGRRSCIPARSRWSWPRTARRFRPSACSRAPSRATTSRTRTRSCATTASAAVRSRF